MSFQEKENIVNIFCALLTSILLGWAVYQRHLEGSFDLTQDYRAWGIIFLIFMGISIVVRIITYIVFYAINAIATREEDVPVVDERAKLIRLLGIRNAHYAFSSGFVLSIVGLALGMPIYTIFIIFIVSGLLSELIDNATQIYFYRKGV